MMEQSKRELAWLFIKAHLIEWFPVRQGSYYLYGAEGKYLEVFVHNDPDKPSVRKILNDLSRLELYASNVKLPR